ncbi:MAG: hypothetical protein E6713_08150 [Sporomusaceae bacterium]|nr:hypothetical protein [Sporomusaceae bacterium]
MFDYGEPLVLGFLTAVMSYFGNTAMVKRLGNWHLITVGPVAEEVLKSSAAWYFGVSLFVVHMTFGSVEGLCEFFQAKGGKQSALLSLLGHSAFGWITNLIFSQTNQIELGILAGTISHVGYNLWVFLYFTKRHSRRS